MEKLISRVQKEISNRYPHMREENILFLTLGGSHLHGTNDGTSDLDARVILFLDDYYQFGLEDFKHKKIVEGEGQINGKDDLDIEMFNLRYFIQKAYEGEFIPVEMLFSPNLYSSNNELIQPLLEVREWFLSKELARKYYGNIKRNFHAAFGDVEKAIQRANRPDKIERLRAFGYESKFAMKSILGLKLVNELLEFGEYKLDRRNIDKKQLLAIKQGDYSKEELLAWFTELDEKQTVLLETSSLREKPDFQKVNEFMIEYQKMLFRKSI